MDRMLEALLLRRFEQIPRQDVPFWDWHSWQGQEFLDFVDLAVEQGIDINEIGSLIGIRNFSQRYAMLKRGKSAKATTGIEGDEHATVGLQPTMPEMWTGTEGQGEVAVTRRVQDVRGLPEEP